MNIIEQAAAIAARNQATRQQTILAHAEWKRTTCNRIARIMRRIGLSDASAEQKDSGRRDVTATIFGKQVTVGVFDDGRIAYLPPGGANPCRPWKPVSPDLSNLPTLLRETAIHFAPHKPA